MSLEIRGSELHYIFSDIKEKEKTFSFGELLKLFKDKTNKQSMQSFYNFLREARAFGVLEKIKRDMFIFKKAGLDGVQ